MVQAGPGARLPYSGRNSDEPGNILKILEMLEDDPGMRKSFVGI